MENRHGYYCDKCKEETQPNKYCGWFCNECGEVYGDEEEDSPNLKTTEDKE